MTQRQPFLVQRASGLQDVCNSSKRSLIATPVSCVEEHDTQCECSAGRRDVGVDVVALLYLVACSLVPLLACPGLHKYKRRDLDFL